MFLGSYHFDGGRDELVPAYERLVAGCPPDALDVHVCVVGDGGLTVFDACPSRELFDSFSRAAEFAAAVAAAGLPAPRVVPVGEVHTALIRQAVLP